MNSADDQRSPELPVPEEGSENATFCRPHRPHGTQRLPTFIFSRRV